MSIGLNDEENDLNTTGPLKIPLPKNGQMPLKCTTGTTTSTTTNSSFIGSLPKRIVLKCDSPQIFSIESRPEYGEGTKQADSAVGDGNKSSGNKLISSNEGKAEIGFEGYREVGTSSGFNSDVDSESPFYSSDIDSDTSEDPPLLWNFADYFANLPGNDWCVRIPQCFIDDEFNLFELADVLRCSLTLTDELQASKEKEEFEEYTFDDLIDFVTIEDLTEDPIPKISSEMLEDSILLYKLIHQRFIMTKAGAQAMWEKFEQQTYGTCPRYYCHDQPFLPLGPSALPGKEAARAYCLNCQDFYQPATQKHAKMDGVAFGPSFAHFFIRTVLYANETKALENRKGSHDWQVYVPKIYGFRIHRDIKEEGIRDERPVDFK